jgi:outer membrane beta-barrel protein
MKSHGNWRENAREWGIRLGVVLGAMLWLTLVAVSWADGSEVDRSPAATPPAKAAAAALESDEYNFSWLDPDKKIYVLQNRRYIKAKHLLLSAMAGTGFSNAYRSAYSVDPRVAFYFSEALGIEAFYSFFHNKENNTFEALQQSAPNTLPVVREIRSQYGLLMHYVPWYAKINVFNKILYFDWYFTGGAGTIRTALDTRTSSASASQFTNQDLFSLFLGTGHQYHLSQFMLVRLDFSGGFYRAPVFGNEGDNAWFSNYVFGLGFGFKL